MHILTVLTLIAAGLIVAALAFYLLAITVLLAKTLSALKTIGEGLQTVAERVEPVEPALRDINEDLLAARDTLRRVAEKAEAKAPEPSSDGEEGSRLGRLFRRTQTAARDDR